MSQPTTAFQDDYWNGPGSQKTFTHSIRWDWLDDIGLDAEVLDYGCGYGRFVGEFEARGYANVRGVDPAAALVERGARAGLPLTLMADPPRVPPSVPPSDLVLLCAVLTCVPADDDQRDLVSEVWRALRPGGLLYVADFLLGEDTQRYETMRPDGSPYGAFTTSEGAVLRHHTAAHLRDLIGGDLVEQTVLPVRTMNGNTAVGIQLLARKP